MERSSFKVKIQLLVESKSGGKTPPCFIGIISYIIELVIGKKLERMILMSRKLYLDNVYTKECTSNILEVEKKDDNFLVVLDQTPFYPEGGGQPSDTGYIGDLYVSHVFEDKDKVYHVTKSSPKEIDNVKCRIDWDKRFDHMQQHLGQHILSACFMKLFSGTTVGFHLGTEVVTLDIDIENFSETQIERVEYFANQIVFNNLQIKQLFPKPSQLKKLSLRKQPQVDENIRIIEIDQFDSVPCCGAHPAYTGEVGLIKIRKLDKIRNSTRVEFYCGNRALRDYSWKNHTINQISSLLSVKDVDTLNGVEKLYADYNELKKEVRNLKQENTQYEADQLFSDAEGKSGIKLIAKVFESRNFGDIRNLSSKVTEKPKTIILLGVKNDKAQLVFSCSKDISIDMNQLFQEVAPIINAKGGGNKNTAQGGGDKKENLEGALKAAVTILEKRYLNK